MFAPNRVQKKKLNHYRKKTLGFWFYFRLILTDSSTSCPEKSSTHRCPPNPPSNRAQAAAIPPTKLRFSTKSTDKCPTCKTRSTATDFSSKTTQRQTAATLRPTTNRPATKLRPLRPNSTGKRHPHHSPLLASCPARPRPPPTPLTCFLRNLPCQNRKVHLPLLPFKTGTPSTRLTSLRKFETRLATSPERTTMPEMQMSEAATTE